MNNKEKPNWSLEEKTFELPPRAPSHANPIYERFGDYAIFTRNVYEAFTENYHLKGELSILKFGRKIKNHKKYFFFGPMVPVEEKFTEWKSTIKADDIDKQLYHPRTLAEVVVEDLKTQGIKVNLEKTEKLLIEALKPYTNRAKLFCVDTNRCRNLGRYNPKCEL
jgi:hypothetical protein